MKKTGIILLLVVLWSSTTFARVLPAYIISVTNDTIFGFVQLSRFDITGNKISLNGYNTDPLYQVVKFRGLDEEKFKAYTPVQLSGFGFNIGTIPYRYLSAYMQNDNNVPRRKCFVLMVGSNNHNTLYKYKSNVVNPWMKMVYQPIEVVEYFVLNPVGELVSATVKR